MEGVRAVGIPLFLLAARIAAHVPPATNVSLVCHNFQNMLYWNYSHPSLQPRFKIDIGVVYGAYEPLWVEGPDLHCNVSFLNDPSNDYRVSVSAVVGQNESEPAPADWLTFSYFSNSMSTVICAVDLPPINITIQSSNILEFSFTHPSDFYQRQLPTDQSRRKKKHKKTHTRRLPEFIYTALTDNQREHAFICERSVCTGKLSVEPDMERHCLTVVGEWESVTTRSLQENCVQATHAKQNYLLLYILAPVLLLAVFFILISLRYFTKVPITSARPAVLNFTGFKQKIAGHSMLKREPAEVSAVLASSPSDATLLSDEEEASVCSPCSSDGRLPIGVGLQGGDSSGPQHQEGESGYMLGREMEDSASNPGAYSHYEQRLSVKVVVAPGEKVEGYVG